MHSTIRVAEAGMPAPRIGCAGWSLPRAQWPHFPPEGSHLERYAARFDAVEIDTSFYRPHRRETYMRWAASTPDGFRFAVKLPRTVTHDRKLVDAMAPFDTFFVEAGGLGDKLGCLLIQLPPSLVFDEGVVMRFLRDVRQRHKGALALEARHASWFVDAADTLLARHRVGRVLADPVLHGATAPGGWPGLVYVRMHGSPRRYWSAYDDGLLRRLADRLAQARQARAECWCILDNTAGGEAVGNALTLAKATSQSVIKQKRQEP
jgi:uncharacterized protein YecE (DUF72 family)